MLLRNKLLKTSSEVYFSPEFVFRAIVDQDKMGVVLVQWDILWTRNASFYNICFRVHSWKQTTSLTLLKHHTRMGCFVPSLDDIVLMVLEKKIFLKCLKLFLPLSPFVRGCYLNTPEFPLYQRVLCAKVVLEKVVNFLYVAIISSELPLRHRHCIVV